MSEENTIAKLKEQIRKLKAQLADAQHQLAVYEDFFKGVTHNG
nr:MAG TPA: protein of unknown function (DUF5320) [Caudoviricetes sp.]